MSWSYLRRGVVIVVLLYPDVERHKAESTRDGEMIGIAGTGCQKCKRPTTVPSASSNPLPAAPNPRPSALCNPLQSAPLVFPLPHDLSVADLVNVNVLPLGSVQKRRVEVGDQRTIQHALREAKLRILRALKDQDQAVADRDTRDDPRAAGI